VNKPFAFLKKSALIVFLFFLITIGSLGVCAVFEIPIPVNFAKGQLQDVTKSALARKVILEGPIQVVPGISPKIRIHQVHIRNPENWPEQNFVTVSSFTGKIDLLALLQRRIHIEQIASDDIDINFETLSSGENNWEFKPAEKSEDPGGTSAGEPFRFDALDELSVADVNITYNGGDTERDIDLQLNIISGTAKAEEPLTISMEGEFRGEAFSGELKGEALALLISGGTRWPFDLKANFADAALGISGAVGGANGLEFNADLKAENTHFGHIAQLFIDAHDVKGNIGTFSVDASSRGKNLAALIRDVQMSLLVNNANLSYGNDTGGKPVSFELNTLDLTLSPAEALRLNTTGRLLGEDFNLELNGGDLETLLTKNPWPMDLSATSAGVRLHAKGTIASPTESAGSELNLEASGEHIGDIAKWIGASPKAASPYSVSGKIAHTTNGWKLKPFKASLGNTHLSGKIEHKKISPRPLLVAALRFGKLDVEELSRTFTSSQPKQKAPEDSKKLSLDMPILPKDIQIGDADINIIVKHLVTAPTDIRDIAFTGNLRNGKIEKSPFQATVGDTLFQGQFKFDPLGDMPRAKFKLFAEKTDIGDLLSRFEIAEGVTASAQRIDFDMLLKGNRLGELAKHSQIKARIKQGSWTLTDANTGGQLPILINDAILEILPEQPVKLTQNVIIRDVPATIEISTDHPATFKKKTDHEVRMALETSGARLDFIGNLKFPLNERELGFSLNMEGDQFSDLNALLGVQLPPFGPYKLRGKFQIRPEGYTLEDMIIQVGQSRLSGQMDMVTSGKRPDLGLDLMAEKIQLDDFREVTEASEESSPVHEGLEKAATETDQANGEQKPFFTIAALTRLNGHLNLHVKDVFSGEDRLGGGVAKITLEDGRFQMNPLELNLPGGSFNAILEIEPEGQELKSRLKAHIDKFDVGVIARRRRPDTDMGGWLSLDMDLASKTPYFRDMLRNAGGYLNFAVKPENFKSGIIDLWAVNIIAAILPTADSSADSVINCLVARFDMKDGIMSHETILLDTGKIRVKGKGKINFKTEDLKIILTPDAKKPAFFSLETPMKIDGKIQDINIGIKKGGGIGTAFRFITSPLTTPFKKLFNRKIPADGSDVCADPMKRSTDIN
jgi:uncharacterized protein involved in outer membrane biogenesis